LSANVAPDTLPADGGEYQALFIRLELDDGSPALVDKDLLISLSSSDHAVALVPVSVILSPNQPAIAVRVITGRISGTATLTASAAGVGNATATLKVVDPNGAVAPYQLSLSLAPSVLTAGSKAAGYVSVELVGKNGIPLVTPQDVVVALTSSRPQVATVDPVVVVREGRYFALAQYRTGQPGDSIIAAQADGFLATSTTLKVTAPGNIPYQLVMYMLPSTGLGGHPEERTILVQALDARNSPAPYPCAPTRLARSQQRIGAITRSLTMPTGVRCGNTTSYGTTTLAPGLDSADGEIFASVDGLLPGTLQVRSLGTTLTEALPPYRLSLDLAPAIMEAQAEAPGYVATGLRGSNGVPLVAPQDVVVALTSSRPEVATVEPTVVVRQGHYFALAQFHTRQPGESTITAQADGFQTSSGTLRVAASSSAPHRLVLHLLPSVGLASDHGDRIILVQAVDAQDNPVPYPCTETHLARSDQKIGAITAPVTLPAGLRCGDSAAYGTAVLSPGPQSAAGQFFASAEGLVSGTIQVRSLGALPTRIAARFAFPTMTAGDSPTNFLVVQFQDATGQPAGLVADSQLFLEGDGLRLDSVVTVRAGSSLVVAPVLMDSRDDTAKVVALAPGLPEVQATVNLVKVALDIKLEARPPSAVPGQQVQVLARVTLKGQPLSGVRLQWSAEGGQVLSANSTTSDDGTAIMVFKVPGPEAARVKVQALLNEATAGGATLSVSPLSPRLQERPAPSISILGTRVPLVVIAVLVGGALVVYLVARYWRVFRPRLPN
jgi:hypothetical protein